VRAPGKSIDKLYLASSNAGKLREFQALANADAADSIVRLELLPSFDALPPFEENAPTFAENALGKALYYSQACDERDRDEFVFADDSGLVVPALGGAPGVHSARYAGPTATSADRIAKLLGEMRGLDGDARRAYFVCVIALAKGGRPVAIVTDRVAGDILKSSQGAGGFGYDPVFYFPPLRKAFAELSADEKNQHSHRGKAFRKLLTVLRDR
jgi:XTP/dITP diphosphohydrolase